MRDTEKLRRLSKLNKKFKEDKRVERIGLILYTLLVVVMVITSLLLYQSGIDKSGPWAYLGINGLLIIGLITLLWSSVARYFKLLSKLSEYSGALLIDGTDEDVNLALEIFE